LLSTYNGVQSSVTKTPLGGRRLMFLPAKGKTFSLVSAGHGNFAFWPGNAVRIVR
jgi:hypothetical protein